MKKVLRLSVFAAISMTVLSITGCKKEGPAGPAGANGSANVTSNTFTVNTWLWDSPYYYVDLPVSAITSANNSTVAVMVYFSTNGNAWVALPYTQYNSPSQNYIMGFVTGVGTVEVNWFYDTSLSDGVDPNAYYGVPVKCKVVVIPPVAMAAHPEVDIKNYEQVKNTFGLQD
jgi:hypothetical protein